MAAGGFVTLIEPPRQQAPGVHPRVTQYQVSREIFGAETTDDRFQFSNAVELDVSPGSNATSGAMADPAASTLAGTTVVNSIGEIASDDVRVTELEAASSTGGYDAVRDFIFDAQAINPVFGTTGTASVSELNPSDARAPSRHRAHKPAHEPKLSVTHSPRK